ncbi:MAG: hypothetical protein K9G44_14220, partial [Melioribacteraceae bacterium]|nr:hypothetical protein [Melioribacteraceae bacterium]
GEYDVSSKDVIDNVHLELNRCIEANDSTLVPVLLLTGRYGIGKTTIMYRAIHDYVLKGGGKAQAFEVLNLDKIKISALDELFKKTNAEIILLNVDHIEIDSAFKNLIKFRNELSIEQFAEYKVILISSIRENILQKHLLRKSYKSIKQIEVSNKLDEDLAGELIKKLESVKLLRFRDQREKQKHIKKIQKEYNGEPFIALTNLLDNTNHNRIIIDAFNQLSEHTKKAVIYTSFLHRFSLMMPSTLLRRLVGLEWDDFIQKIITFDSKGLLIQFENHSSGVEPDIYFHTPHQLLADDVVKLFYPKEDSRFYMYVEIIKKIEVGLSSAKLIVDLLKGLRLSEDLSQEKINKLFDSCPQELELDPHFMIHYSLNIQYRYEEKSIKKALEKITYLQSVLDSRNHFLIHRRATLNFQLAKLNYDREKELDKTLEYIKEARDLFNLKLIIDPFSSYSYINFVQMEIWYLSKAKLNRVDELRQISIIEDLISQGEQKAFENVHNISELRKDLSRIMTVEMGKNEEEILNNLDEMKLDSRYAAYAFILEFYIYEKKDDKPKLEEVVNNLNEYIHLDEVAKVLFKYYGKNLHQFENRMIFEKIVNNNKNLEKQYPVLYHYYNYVIEAYKHHFSLSKDHLYSLRANFKYLNPQLTEVWRNEVTNEPEIFEGIVKKNKYGSFKVAVVELTQTFGLKKSSYKNIDLSSNSKHKVKLYFYLTGIRAELIS